eukprot:TRINITY_DN63835_c0_g1_i1.p1 TRINITY_DN63835_c0_g1~~TRINITY_DN63835_c0_g1_i1.p1  ORF type:complete len:503 (-),score=88.46 TRINITY_DN63835_c0_g1_i1:44-1552(-)
MTNGYPNGDADELTIWEVVGGADKGGVIVRIDEDISSTPEPERLTTGSLVVQVELVGDRLRYNRIAGTGAGPNSGWVSVRTLRGKELLVQADVKAPRAGWRVLQKELPIWSPPPVRERPQALTDGGGAGFLPIWRDEDEMTGAGSGSVVGPEYVQTPGEPYVYYHKVGFNDSKPTGLRMSACMNVMDECRTDLFSICDQTVETFAKATDPFILCAIELHPAIAQLDRAKAEDGMLYTHPRSRGAISSWLRIEAEFGWPMFPLRTEEQTIYLVGKQPRSADRTPIATGRFTEALVDENTESMMQGETWQGDVDRFFARVKSDHSNARLNEAKLSSFYRQAGKAFEPTLLKQVTWTMSAAYADLWAILYHAKTPELLWDLNRLAGGAFAELVERESDPQALVISLPQKMQVGETYTCLCYLDESSKKAVYVLLPAGSSNASDCVLCVVARYDWANAPQDGATLSSEDVELPNSGPGRGNLVKFALGDSADVKPSKLLDLSKCRV